MKRIMETPLLFCTQSIFYRSVCDRIIEEGKNLIIESAGVNVLDAEE